MAFVSGWFLQKKMVSLIDVLFRELGTTGQNGLSARFMRRKFVNASWPGFVHRAHLLSKSSQANFAVFCRKAFRAQIPTFRNTSTWERLGVKLLGFEVGQDQQTATVACDLKALPSAPLLALKTCSTLEAAKARTCRSKTAWSPRAAEVSPSRNSPDAPSPL